MPASRKAASLATTTRTTTQVSRILCRPEVSKTNPYLQAHQSLPIITLTQRIILKKSKSVKACQRSNTPCKRISQAPPGLLPTKKRHCQLAIPGPRPQNSKRRWDKALPLSRARPKAITYSSHLSPNQYSASRKTHKAAKSNSKKRQKPYSPKTQPIIPTAQEQALPGIGHKALKVRNFSVSRL